MFEAGSGIIGSLRRAVGWWTGELASCVPAVLSQAIRANDAQLIIELTEIRATLRHRHNQSVSELGEIDLQNTTPSQQRSAFATLTDGIKMSGLETVLHLSAHNVLKTVVALPAAAASNLYEVLGFEMDRKTPFRATEVYYSGEVLSQNRTDGSIQVNVLVATKPVVERAVSVLRGWGVVPRRVDAAGAAGGSRVDLLAGGLANGRAKGIDFSGVVLAMVAVGLLMGSFALPVWKRDQALNRLIQQVDGAKAEAKITQGLRGKIDGLLAGAEFLAKQRAQRGSISQLLHEVTRVVPDNGWVTRLHLRDGTLRLTGYSEEASDLIALLESSPMLKDVKFVSPVTRDTRVGVDRFSLTATSQSGVTDD